MKKNTTANATYQRAISIDAIAKLNKGDKVSFIGAMTNDKHVTRMVHIDTAHDEQPYIIFNHKDIVIDSGYFQDNCIVTAINGVAYETPTTVTEAETEALAPMATEAAETHAARLHKAFINGTTLANLSDTELDFIRTEYAETHIESTLFGTHVFTPIAQYNHIERECMRIESAHETADSIAADMALNDAEAVASDTVTDTAIEPIATRFAIRKNDKPWKMDATELAQVYNLHKTAHKAMFTIGDDKDATRILYRRIDTDTPYVQYHGEFWAISEDDVLPLNGDIHTTYAVPEKPARTTADKPAKKHDARYTWVSFEADNTTLARKVYVDDDEREYIKLNKANVFVSELANVVHHVNKANADKRVNSARKANKAADKANKAADKAITDKANKAANKAVFIIPDSILGVPVNAEKASANWDDDKWAQVVDVCASLELAGMPVGHIDVDRDWAWCYPKAAIGFTDAFAKAIERTSVIGYSKKASRGAYFVKAC